MDATYIIGSDKFLLQERSFSISFFSLFLGFGRNIFFQFWEFFDTFLRRNIQMCRFHPSSRGFLAEAKSETCDANAELTVGKSFFSDLGCFLLAYLCLLSLIHQPQAAQPGISK